MRTLQRLRPLTVVVLLALAASCKEATLSLGLPNQSCLNLFVIEGFDRPINAQVRPEVVPVGSARNLRVRVLPERDYPLGADLYDHCPTLALDRVRWAIVDSSVVLTRGTRRGGEAHGTGDRRGIVLGGIPRLPA